MNHWAGNRAAEYSRGQTKAHAQKPQPLNEALIKFNQGRKVEPVKVDGEMMVNSPRSNAHCFAKGVNGADGRALSQGMREGIAGRAPLGARGHGCGIRWRRAGAVPVCDIGMCAEPGDLSQKFYDSGNAAPSILPRSAPCHDSWEESG